MNSSDELSWLKSEEKQLEHLKYLERKYTELYSQWNERCIKLNERCKQLDHELLNKDLYINRMADDYEALADHCKMLTKAVEFYFFHLNLLYCRHLY